NFGLHIFAKSLYLGSAENFVFQHAPFHLEYWIQFSSMADIFFTSILSLVVGRGMRIDTDDFRFNKNRDMLISYRLDQIRHGFIDTPERSSIDLHCMDAETLCDLPNRRGRLCPLWNADGVTVVLDHEQHGKRFSRCPIQSLKEFAFACCTFPRLNIYD